LLPGPHAPVALWLTGQKQVPVLRLDGRTINDSTRIIDELERRFPDPPLLPTDEAQRKRALELEEHFDYEIGPPVRRVLFPVILLDGAFMAGFMSTGFGPTARALYRWTFPLTRAIMRFDMGIDDDAAARSLARFDAALARLEREIQPSGY